MAKLTSNGVTIEGTPEELAAIMKRFSTEADVVESIGHTFSEGDKVRVNNYGEFGGVDIGEIGKVGVSLADDDDAYSVKVEGDDDHDYFRPQDIELITEAEVAQAEADAIESKRTEVFTSNGRKVNEYREGDIVRITFKGGEAVNIVGDVEDVGIEAIGVSTNTGEFSDYNGAYFDEGDKAEPLVFVESRLDRN